MMFLRWSYLAVVLLGLWIAWTEHQHARWVYNQLWTRKINGVRQMLALTLRREEYIRLWVFALLSVPAIVGIVIHLDWHPSTRTVRVLILLSIATHIAMVVLLTLRALIMREARRRILDVAEPTVQ